MSSEQLLEQLRKEVLDKKKEDIIRDLVSQRISEFSGQPLQPIQPLENTSANLLASRMEALLNVSSAEQGASDNLSNNQKN